MEALNAEVIPGVVTAVLIAVVLGVLRLLVQMRDLVQRESAPNGGTSAKDHMRRTSEALEALRAEQGRQAEEQRRQTLVLEDIRGDLKEHNELTSQVVRGLIEQNRRAG